MISISNASKKPDTAYAQIPVWLTRGGKAVTPGALKLYAALKSYTKNGRNHAYPSQETLAEDLGVSSRQVRTYMQQLHACGGVRYQLRINKQGKTSRNYEYQLAWDRPFREDEEYRNDSSGDEIPTGRKLPPITGRKLPLDTGTKLPSNYTYELHPSITTPTASFGGGEPTALSNIGATGYPQVDPQSGVTYMPGDEPPPF